MKHDQMKEKTQNTFFLHVSIKATCKSIDKSTLDVVDPYTDWASRSHIKQQQTEEEEDEKKNHL